jgi:hypothetical protein
LLIIVCVYGTVVEVTNDLRVQSEIRVEKNQPFESLDRLIGSYIHAQNGNYLIEEMKKEMGIESPTP